MSDPDSQALQPLPRVEPFDFHGDPLIAVIVDGHEVVLPIRSVCGALGLDPPSQSERLREHDVLSQGLRIVKIPVGNRVQSVLAINRRYLAFWLATITPSQVSDIARPKLVSYQHELVDMLDALYGTGMAEAAESGVEPSLATINARFAALIAELRITREALLAAQRQTEAKVDAQDVRLSTVEELVGQRLTTIQGQLDEAQQRLLDTVKITAAQQSVIRRAIERLAKRYEKKTGKAIYDMLHMRFRA